MNEKNWELLPLLNVIILPWSKLAVLNAVGFHFFCAGVSSMHNFYLLCAPAYRVGPHGYKINFAQKRFARIISHRARKTSSKKKMTMAIVLPYTPAADFHNTKWCIFQTKLHGCFNNSIMKMIDYYDFI